jgi:predicted permease
MPDEFAFPTHDIEAWLPSSSAERGSLDPRTFRVIARTRQGASAVQVREDVIRVMREIRHPAFGMSGSGSATVTALTDAVRGPVRPVLRASATGSLLVLLVTCANVGILLVGRAASRRRDAAVRLALGASRAALVRTSLIESCILSTTGTVAGLWGAYILLRALSRVMPGQPLDNPIPPPVLLAAAVATAVLTLMFGAIAAAALARSDVSGVLRGSQSMPPRSRRVLSLLVAAQIAAAVVLLAGTTLLWRTVTALLAEDPGVDPQRTLTLRLPLASLGGLDDQTTFVNTVLDRIRALPGVEAAGVGSSLPPRALPFQIYVRFVGPGRDEGLRMSVVAATPGFLPALGAHLRSGREFEYRTDGQAASEVVLSESASRFASPDSDLTGRELPIRLPPVAAFPSRPRVTGIVGDIKYAGLDLPAAAAVYLPWRLRPATTAYLAVRTTADPMPVAPAVRRIIRETDPRFPIGEFRSLDEQMAYSILDRRLRVVPALGFAVVGLIVALAGVFALLARAAAERRREFAIRLALGAAPGEVVGMMLRGALALVTCGSIAGLAGAAIVATALRSLLYGVRPYDPATLVGVVLLVTAAALAAAFVPARHAGRTEPLELLRVE